MDDDDMDMGRLLRAMTGTRDKAFEGRILNAVMPSDHIPKAGNYFRVRFAAYADRSYMDVIWKCLAHQDHAVVGSAVHGSVYGDKRKTFVIGDMLFYDATELWTAIEADRVAELASQTAGAAS
jgi:hypothetical protein